MRKSVLTQTCKHMPFVSLIILLVTSMFVVLPFFVAEPVLANPSPVVFNDLFYSQPTAQTISPTSPSWVTTPLNARDKDNATFAQFNYGTAAAGYFEVRTFKTQTVKAAPYPVIQQVDLKMRYEAEANTDGETYSIDYSVLPSTTLQPLQAATGAVYGPDTRVWSAQSEPNDGMWTWTDIGNIKIRVTVSGTAGGTMSSLFKEYEAWATVVIVSSPKLLVDPANITDVAGGKAIGSTFTVDVRLENISSSAGTEFKFRYDAEILNITSTVPTPPASPAEDQALPSDFIYATGTIWTYSVDRIKGIFYISYTSGPLAAPPPPTFGSGKVAEITFKVLGQGLTTLKLYDTIQGQPGGGAISHDVSDGYFRNVVMPYGAGLKIIAPSAPVSVPFTAQINITKPPGMSGAFGVYSWEFNMTYDKTVINATAVWQDTFLSSAGPTTFSQNVGVNEGWVWTNATLNGDVPGAWGNGTIATVDFDILAGGTPGFNFIQTEVRLTRIDYGAGPPSPKYSLPVYVAGVPVSSFTYSPMEPKVSQTVSFDASTSFVVDGTIVDYSWNFGDGSTFNSVNPQATHAYSTKGTHTVNLTVTDNDGNSGSSTKTVTVNPRHPVASFTYFPSEPKVNEVVTLNATGSTSPDGAITQYSWNFGDASSGVGKVVTHSYTSVGIYVVNLTVIDENTLVNSTVISVTINRMQSQVSISLNDSSIDLGSAVTISGSISPVRASVSVTIQYRIGSGAWANLTSRTTDADGAYTYSWTPQTAGDYEVRALWNGDASTEPDTSEIQTLRVEAPQEPTQEFPILWYALAGIIIALVIVVGLVVYFKKFRKR